MGILLDGFASELVKIAKKSEDEDLQRLYRTVRREQGRAPESALTGLRGKGRQVSRDYLASLLLGAAATPLLSIAGGKISRALHNKQIVSALKKARTPKEVRQLRRELYTGKAVGRYRPGMRPQEKPILTPAELGADVSKGALYGSVLQMLRDRYSGSAGVG